MLREKLILASKSPRRADILRSVGWEFEAIDVEIDETRQGEEDAVAYVKRLAKAKADAVARKVKGGLVLGADTVVVIDNQILGQPRTQEDARRMLRMLSNRWHHVLTGVALVRASMTAPALVDHQTTRVLFAELTPQQIDWYIQTGEPSGKAGAYAIQGKAALFINGIQGDFFNVVGLPLRLVFEMSRRI